jgi:hypothetical protein
VRHNLPSGSRSRGKGSGPESPEDQRCAGRRSMPH